MGPVTRRAIITGVVDYACPDRIQLDVTQTGQQVTVFLNDAGLKPAFE